MDMLRSAQLAQLKLADWRKLAQGLHARYLVDDFSAGVRFLASVGEAGNALGHHPSVAMSRGYVDLKLVSDDAVYRTDDGTEYIVQWPTQRDVDLARRITEIAAEHQLAADPASVSMLELGLDTPDAGVIAPMWAILLTGDPSAQGRGTPGDEVRDATGRVPNLWFGVVADSDTDADAGAGAGAGAKDGGRHRFHVEVYLPPEVVRERIDAAVAAGGTIVDDSESPGLTVIADADGNRGIVCADVSAAGGDTAGT